MLRISHDATGLLTESSTSVCGNIGGKWKTLVRKCREKFPESMELICLSNDHELVEILAKNVNFHVLNSNSYKTANV